NQTHPFGLLLKPNAPYVVVHRGWRPGDGDVAVVVAWLWWWHGCDGGEMVLVVMMMVGVALVGGGDGCLWREW
ncbi:hypothetical protein Tco_1453634, partial [Tanacetum coccineum]